MDEKDEVKFYPVYLTAEELAVMQVCVGVMVKIPFTKLQPRERYVKEKAKELEKKLQKEAEAIKALDALK